MSVQASKFARNFAITQFSWIRGLWESCGASPGQMTLWCAEDRRPSQRSRMRWDWRLLPGQVIYNFGLSSYSAEVVRVQKLFLACWIGIIPRAFLRNVNGGYTSSSFAESETRGFVEFLQMLRWFAGKQIRNVAVSIKIFMWLHSLNRHFSIYIKGWISVPWHTPEAILWNIHYVKVNYSSVAFPCSLLLVISWPAAPYPTWIRCSSRRAAPCSLQDWVSTTS